MIVGYYYVKVYFINVKIDLRRNIVSLSNLFRRKWKVDFKIFKLVVIL